jgi:hypothetical protein
MPVIGFLSTRSPEDIPHLLATFRRGLAENGYVEDQNVMIEYRWALGRGVSAFFNTYREKLIALAARQNWADLCALRWRGK